MPLEKASALLLLLGVCTSCGSGSASSTDTSESTSSGSTSTLGSETAASGETESGPTTGTGTTVSADSTSETGVSTDGTDTSASSSVRIATYNIEFLNDFKLDNEADPQVNAAVDVVNRVSPDVLVVQEIQYDINGNGLEPGTFNVGATHADVLAARLNDAGAVPAYAHTVIALGNHGYAWDGYEEGVHDPYFEQRSGTAGTAGRLSLAVVSRYPIVEEEVQVIVDFAWTDLPNNLVAQLEADEGIVVPEGYPLFSSALLIVPVDVNGTIVDIVALHASNPVGSGGYAGSPYRNHDNLAAVRHLIEGTLPGVEGLRPDSMFVVLGDLNADPDHGDAFPDGILGLLEHQQLAPIAPTGPGTAGVNPERNTTVSVCPTNGGPDPTGANGFQLDYILPAAVFGEALDFGMFYPSHIDDPADWAVACAGSNHMLLWVELPL